MNTVSHAASHSFGSSFFLGLFCATIFALVVLTASAYPHDGSGSHDHAGGLGRFSLAKQDRLVFSIGETNCTIRYLGKGEMGYELESSLYKSELVEQQVDSGYHLIQAGETFTTGEVMWRLITKPGTDIILEPIQQP